MLFVISILPVFPTEPRMFCLKCGICTPLIFVMPLSQDERLQNEIQKNYLQWKKYLKYYLSGLFQGFFAYLEANSPSSKFQGFGWAFSPFLLRVNRREGKAAAWMVIALLSYVFDSYSVWCGIRSSLNCRTQRRIPKESVSSSFPSDEGLNGALEGAIHLPMQVVRRRNIHQLHRKGTKWK